MTEIHFSLGDKLPTIYYDVAITIFFISTQPTSSKMTHVIHQYLALINIWQKAFGSQHVMSIRTVKSKLHKIVKDYFNKVYNKHHRKSKKKKTEAANEAKRQNNCSFFPGEGISLVI